MYSMLGGMRDATRRVMTVSNAQGQAAGSRSDTGEHFQRAGRQGLRPTRAGVGLPRNVLSEGSAV
jgi:hypothetical protein